MFLGKPFLSNTKQDLIKQPKKESQIDRSWAKKSFYVLKRDKNSLVNEAVVRNLRLKQLRFGFLEIMGK